MSDEAPARGQIIRDLERRFEKPIEQIVIEAGRGRSDAEAAAILRIKRGTYRWLRWRCKIRRKSVLDLPAAQKESA